MKFKNLSPMLDSYFSRNQLLVQRARFDGAVVVVVDVRYRVFIRPAPHGDLVLESKLVSLPSKKNEADELIELCLMGSWVRMLEFAEVPVLSENQEEILLQYRVSMDATVDDFEMVLGQFVNSLSEWHRILRVI